MTGIYCIGALELLVVSGGAKRLDELWSEMLMKFQCVPDFYSSICPTIKAFERFIIKQTALFKVFDDIVYIADVFDELNKSQYVYNTDRPHHSILSFQENVPEVSNFSDDFELEKTIPEIEAVEYLQSKLLRISERWIPIKCLSEHSSQAPLSIRPLISPKENILSFLLRHPIFFEIKGDCVGLATSCKLRGSWSGRGRLNRPFSYQGDYKPLKSAITQVSSDNTMIFLNLSDCKAVMWLIEHFKNTPPCQVSIKYLLSQVILSPKVIHDVIGWTQIELIEFLKKYSQLFRLNSSQEYVTLKNTADFTLIVLSERPELSENNMLLGHRGNVFRVEKLWGIIDLGFHEHVFFDKSLFNHVTDLTKHFKVNDSVCFNAQRAPKESRAKWRATCVWKETDKSIDAIHCASTSFEQEGVKTTVEDCDSGLENSQDIEGVLEAKASAIKQKHFADISSTFDYCADKFAGLRIVEPWEVQAVISNPDNNSNVSLNHVNNYKFVDQTTKNCDRSSSSSPVSEMNTLSDVPSISACGLDSPLPSSDKHSGEKQLHCVDTPEYACKRQLNIGELLEGNNQRSSSSVSTQTLFTGEIMATKLYHDGLAPSNVD